MQQHSAKAAVAALAFAPDGTSLAVGSADNVVYLHAAADGYALFGICDQHVAPVVALDFSADSKYVRSACAGRDLKFCTALDGSKAEPEAMKELTWASETVPYGWHCKGCYPADAGALPAPPAQLTAFGKSPADVPVLAAGDAMGVTHLFAYPANEPGAGSTDIAAHVGAIGALAFTGAGALLTAGSADGAIPDWGSSRADRARENSGGGKGGLCRGIEARPHDGVMKNGAGGRTGVEVSRVTKSERARADEW